MRASGGQAGCPEAEGGTAGRRGGRVLREGRGLTALALLGFQSVRAEMES